MRELVNSMTFVRLISVAVVFILKSSLHPALYGAIFVAMLFTHYVLAVDTNKIRKSLQDVPWRLVGLISISAALVALLLGSMSNPAVPFISVYFGIHLSLTDTYSVCLMAPQWKGAREKVMIFSRFCLYLVVYALLLHKVMPFKLITENQWLLILACAFLIDFTFWTRFANSSLAFDVLAFNLVAMAAAIVFKDRGLFFFDLVFYHVVFWIVLSLKRAYREQRVRIFARNTAAITGVFLLFSPISFAPLNQSMAFWISMSNAFGIVHISLTFATSRYNPEFIVRLFGGSPLSRDRQAA